MAKRVTFTIDDVLDRRIKEYQAKMMLDTNKAYRYSDAINDMLARVSDVSHRQVCSGILLICNSCIMLSSGESTRTWNGTGRFCRHGGT